MQGFDDQVLFPPSLKSVTLTFERLVAATLNMPGWVVWADLLASGPLFLPCEGHDVTFGAVSLCPIYSARGNPNFIPHLLTAPTFALLIHLRCRALA
jgi:hypothetical protein